jgi:hypothetical protein
VLTFTHIFFRTGGVSDGCTHSFMRNKSSLKNSKAKHLYREDAKYAKKHQTNPDSLSSFALFASSR